ncbi:hypothetical protein [Halocatena halophila]|uniref:hypothetical protein n=1 Tax=Halocatena halophila TaxID=2814576 RepID=UPI002ED08D6D
MSSVIATIVSLLTQLVPTDLSSVSFLSWAGDRDPIYDLLILTGPLVIVLISVVGRMWLTTGLAIGYLLVFVGHLLHSIVTS